MATVAIMVGGAVLNAATFIGGNYLAKYLSGDSGQAALDEKKRHDLALEKYQRDYAQYQLRASLECMPMTPTLLMLALM